MALCSGNSPEKPGFFHTFRAFPHGRHRRCGRSLPDRLGLPLPAMRRGNVVRLLRAGLFEVS
jgi:hypothetical protein